MVESGLRFICCDAIGIYTDQPAVFKAVYIAGAYMGFLLVFIYENGVAVNSNRIFIFYDMVCLKPGGNRRKIGGNLVAVYNYSRFSGKFAFTGNGPFNIIRKISVCFGKFSGRKKGCDFSF